MKAKPNQSNPQLIGFLTRGIPTAIIAAAMPLSAQVVIEGGPGTVQVSDNDGQPETVNSTPEINTPITRTVPTTGPAPDGNTAITVQPNGLEDTAVAVPVMRENRIVAPTGPVAAVTRVPDPVTQTNPTTVKRLAELRRLLAIQDNGSQAAVAVTTKGLFKDETNTIDELSEARLKQIAEYLRLSEEDQVDVTYHYVAREENKDTAWERSLAIVDWMSTKGQISKDSFRLIDPVAAVATPDRTNPQNPEDTETVGWIELSMR